MEPVPVRDATTNDHPAGPRFGLLSLMLLMLVFSVMGAAGYYLMRSVQYGTSPKAVFVLFTLAAPGLLVAVLSMARLAATWLSR